MEDIVSDAAGLLGLNVFLWLVSLYLGKTWPVDFIWSCWPCYQCIVILARWRGASADVARSRHVRARRGLGLAADAEFHRAWRDRP